MKSFIRLLKILFISSTIAIAGAWLILYYLNYRVGDLKVIQALAWEPFIVIASFWFIANLVLVFFLRQENSVKIQLVSPMLSGAALADLHTDDQLELEPKNNKPDSIKQEPDMQVNRKGRKKDKNRVKEKNIEKSENKGKNSNKNKSAKEKSAARPKGSGDTVGVIKWFNGQKGYGFITSEAGEEVFLHCRSLKPGGTKQLHTGQQVSFNKLTEDKGFKAEQVEILE